MSQSRIRTVFVEGVWTVVKVYTYMCLCTRVCPYILMCILVYKCLYSWVYVYMFRHLSKCLIVRTYMYVVLYAGISVYTWMSDYVYVGVFYLYVYIHTWSFYSGPCDSVTVCDMSVLDLVYTSWKFFVSWILRGSEPRSSFRCDVPGSKHRHDYRVSSPSFVHFPLSRDDDPSRSTVSESEPSGLWGPFSWDRRSPTQRVSRPVLKKEFRKPGVWSKGWSILFLKDSSKTNWLPSWSVLTPFEIGLPEMTSSFTFGPETCLKWSPLTHPYPSSTLRLPLRPGSVLHEHPTPFCTLSGWIPEEVCLRRRV